MTENSIACLNYSRVKTSSLKFFSSLNKSDWIVQKASRSSVAHTTIPISMNKPQFDL